MFASHFYFEFIGNSYKKTIEGGGSIQRKLNVLLVKPYELPKEITINNTLKDKQNCVEGLIEYYRSSLYEDVIFICNEEGKINGMEPNRDVKHDILFGPFLIVGDDPELGEDRSLTKEQIEKYKKIFDKESIKETEAKIIGIKLSSFKNNDYEL